MVTALRVDPLTPTTLLNLGHVRAALLHRHLRCTAYTVEHRAGALTVTARIGRADGSPLDVATMQRVLRDLGAAYRDVMGRHFPAMTLVQVAALAESEARLEIEATAIVPG